VKPSEWKWCWAFAAVVVGITSLPYVMGYFSQGEAWRFTGFVFAVQDGNSYIAKMLAGSSGAWLFKTPYTAEPQAGVLAFLPYILLGKLAAGEALHEQLVALFHLFRVVAIFALVPATYRFAGIFLPGPSWRKWVTVMATLGGGFGWVLVLAGLGNWGGSLPLDFYSPETFGFLAVLGLPHLVLARALLLLGLTSYLASYRSARQAWLAGFLFLVMGLAQPLSLVSAFAVIGGHLLVLAGAASVSHEWSAWRGWVRSGIQAVIATSPIAAYTVIAYARDPFLQAWASQNRILSPIPGHYLVAYGILIVPALLGVRYLISGTTVVGLLPTAWMIIVPALAYAPVNVQRRLPEGAWVAILVLAAIGLSKFAGSSPRARWVGPAFMAVSLPTSLLLLGGSFSASIHPSEPLFRPTAEIQLFEWIGKETDRASLVLAAFDTGNVLPAWAPVRVVVGHGPESAGLNEVLPRVEAFYTVAVSDEYRSAFLREYGVSLVVWGPKERRLGSWDAASANFLEQVHEAGDYRLFKVVQR